MIDMPDIFGHLLYIEQANSAVHSIKEQQAIYWNIHGIQKLAGVNDSSATAAIARKTQKRCLPPGGTGGAHPLLDMAESIRTKAFRADP